MEGVKVIKKRAYERYLEAVDKRIKNERIDDFVTGEIQLSILEALRDHVTWCRNPSKSQPLPEEMAFELVIYFRDLVAGFTNIYTTPNKKDKIDGSFGRQPDEKICIKHAIKYLRYVESGKIEDDHPIDTIMSNYSGNSVKDKLSVKTIEKWSKDPLLTNMRSDDLDPGLVISFMEFSGNYYRNNYSKSIKVKKPKNVEKSIKARKSTKESKASKVRKTTKAKKAEKTK